MGHISTLGAGMFSTLAISRLPQAATGSQSALKAFFTTEVANGQIGAATNTQFVNIKDIKEFPAMGTPPNIVKVPLFGSKTSMQIQGQADAPTMDITLAYKGAEWQKSANYLGDLIGKNKLYAFRFTLLNKDSSGITPSTKYASLGTGLGTVENSQYFWYGKLEALVVNPQLNDANTCTLTISVQSEVYGAFTSVDTDVEYTWP
jgi:hypothetical protein